MRWLAVWVGEGEGVALRVRDLVELSGSVAVEPLWVARDGDRVNDTVSV